MRASTRFPVSSKLILSIVLFFQIAPVVMIIQTAFKTPRSILEGGVFNLNGWTLANFNRIFVEQSLSTDLSNSIAVALGSTLLSVTSGTMMAYALTRWQSRKKKHLITSLLVARLLPPWLWLCRCFCCSINSISMTRGLVSSSPTQPSTFRWRHGS